MEFEVRALSEGDFAALELEWSNLLADSTADPLFMSWAWLYSWWEVWSRIYGLELLLLGVYRKEGGELVGLAPLYRHAFRSLGGIRIRRLHFIGNAWRVGPSVRTEYVGLIIRNGYEGRAACEVAGYLKKLTWDELIISDSYHKTAGAFGEALVQSGDILDVIRSEATGICIETSGSYEHWVQGLGPNTRLKAINRRSFFEVDMDGEYRPFEPGEDGHRRFFKQLNQFHLQRWGKPCFDESAVDFHLRLLSRLGANQSPKLTTLVCDNEVASVLYDIQAADRIYNLQAGFNEALHKKLSPGTLHLGYAIRDAFEDGSVRYYDLLAGSGKNTFYKAKFNGEEVGFTTLEFVRSPFLKLAHQCQAWLPKRIKTRINRVFRL